MKTTEAIQLKKTKERTGRLNSLPRPDKSLEPQQWSPDHNVCPGGAKAFPETLLLS